MQIFLGNKERASAAVLAWLQCAAAWMAAQSSTTKLPEKESPTEMPSPTASEKNEVWDWEIVQSPDEAWPRPAEARAAQAARAAAASWLREEFPDLECTTHDLSADQENTKHASDLKAAANTFHKAAEKLSEAEEMQLLSLAGEGLPPAEDKAADKDVHRPNGSEHADASDSDSILLPFNSPFHWAIEFGITEKTSTKMGLPELVDAEEIVPALRLDLKTATQVQVEIALANGLVRLEEKYVFCFF